MTRYERWHRRHRSSTDLVIYVGFCAAAWGLCTLLAHLFA